MKFKYFLSLILMSYTLITAAQAVQNHGPWEVYYTVDVAEGKNGRLFISTTSGIYFSDDLGAEWHKLEASLNSIYINAYFATNNRNGDFYVWDSQQHGVYSTRDNGDTWDIKLLVFPTGDEDIQALAIDGDTLFIGTKKGLKFFYGDDAVRYSTEIASLQNKEITSLYVNGKTVIAGTKDDGIFFSPDLGQTWDNRSNGLPSGYDVRGIITSGNKIYIFSEWKGIYYSDDNGSTWNERMRAS